MREREREKEEEEEREGMSDRDKEREIELQIMQLIALTSTKNIFRSEEIKFLMKKISNMSITKRTVKKKEFHRKKIIQKLRAIYSKGHLYHLLVSVCYNILDLDDDHQSLHSVAYRPNIHY